MRETTLSNAIVFEQLPAIRKSLRIAVVTETYPPEVNGVAMTVAHFIEGLRKRNHEVQLVRPRQDSSDCAGNHERFHEVLMRGLPIPRYPSLKMGLPAKKSLVQLWTMHRPDLVHIVTEGPLGWSALQAALKLKLPMTSDFRTNFHAYSRHYGIGWLKKPIAAYLRKFHNRCLLTMVPTEAMRSDLAAIGFRNLRVVARGGEVELIPCRHHQSCSEKYVRQIGAQERRLVRRRKRIGADGTDNLDDVGRIRPRSNDPRLLVDRGEQIRDV